MTIWTGIGLVLLALSRVALADGTDVDRAPHLTDLARTEEGRPRIVTQSEAVQYCRSLRLRLPTAWELGLAAKLEGIHLKRSQFEGKPFSDNDVQREMYTLAGKKFVPVWTTLGSGQMVLNFYFNNAAYPNIYRGDMGLWFWSSTPGEDRDSCLFFNGTAGDFGNTTCEGTGGGLTVVRCVAQ